MSQPKEADSGALQFAWGDKRARGKDNVQFYGSFTYDGVEYFLYDCVFLYQEGEPEPYIGKIIKIWENQLKKRRVKILWFFRPIEVRNFLGGYKQPIWNEVFLACGEGGGLSNVNPLEAVAGKCNVICTSKDERNPLPSEEDLKLADYIFYRTFDVGTRTISEQIGDDIGGVEAKHIFNWKDVLKKSVIGERSDKNVASEKSRHSLGLLASDQDVAKNLSVSKAISKSEPPLDTHETKASLDSSDDRPPKKTKLVDSEKLSENLLMNGSTLTKPKVVLNEIDKKTSADVTKASLDKPKSRNITDSVGLNKATAMKPKLNAMTSKLSDKSVASPHHIKEQQVANEPVVIPRKPEDTSKWFTGLPWEDRMWKAHEQETLLLIENFDISYTAEEIEDLIYHFFKKKCTARVIELSTFSNPYNGQALIICKSRGDADEIIKELRMRVLLLSNGRPLVARRVIPRQPGKSSKFYGHLHIDKLKHLQREEWRKAVFTSHCSQPNTIEYEMGMEWMLLQERSSSWWKELHKMHKDEIRRTMKEPRK